MFKLFPPPPTIEEYIDYTDWRNDFMWHRLSIVLTIGIASFLTFILLNLSRYPNYQPPWLWTNLSQEVLLLLSLRLLYSKLGRAQPGLILLLLSWSVTIIPQYWFLQAGIAKLDFVTWTLVFLIQATFIPLQWRLHFLSQLGVCFCFIAIRFWSSAQLESQIALADPLFLYLYMFWFCVICNISVYLYERLQRAEFQARKQLQQEQQKSEHLLLNILPSQIAERLKKSHAILADDFAHVTVLFADIVGFTEISAKLRPPKLVELLNEVFSIFDNLVAKHGVEKIKTIGDAYMVVAGLPAQCDNHISKIANLALDMQQAIFEFEAYPLSIRIGIHTGPVVAGVIGIRKIAYDLWGDTVNLASRMESQGLAGQIQVSDRVYEALQDKYVFEERGRIQVKGKGEMTTYILRGVKKVATTQEFKA